MSGALPVVLFMRQGQYHVAELLSETPPRVRYPALVQWIHVPVQGQLGGMVGLATSVAFSPVPVETLELEPEVQLHVLDAAKPIEAGTITGYRDNLASRSAPMSSAERPHILRR